MRQHAASMLILIALALCTGCGDGGDYAQASAEEPYAEEQSGTENDGAAADTQGDGSKTSKADVAQSSTSSGPLGTLRVMTYNIQHGGALGTRLDAVADVIKAQAPDVVGLNEVQHLMPDSAFKKEAEELAAKTGLTAQYFGCTTNCGDVTPGRYGIAMLSRYPLSDRTKTFLPNQTDGSVDMVSSIEPRVLPCGTVDPPSLPAIRFCVTHLTNGSTQESAAIRKLQAQAIVHELELQSQPHGGRVVLTGDMNTNPGTEPIKTLQDFLADSWLEGAAGVGATIPSDAPTARWDYIFHGTGFGKATEAKVPDTTASDHRPVAITLPVLP